MKIIEQFVSGKNGPALCEDALSATEHFVAVIDGSTSKSKLPPLKDGKTRGQVAADAVMETIIDVEPSIDLAAFCNRATEMLRMKYNLYYDADIFSHMEVHPEDRFCCSAIIYSLFHNEIWMIGDCHGLVLNLKEPEDKGVHLLNNKPYEARLARRRSEVLKQALDNGATIEDLRENDPGRKAILPELVEAMRQQNLGYPVIDGFQIPLKKVKRIGNFPKGSTQLVLASDGYPKLLPTLEATEAYLKRCLQNDPLCIKRHKATKGLKPGSQSFDDRAYIRIEL